MARPLAFSFVIWSGIDTAGLRYNMGFSASEIKRENPVKSENLPGCAVQVGSVAGIIAYNVSNRAFDVKLYFTRVHAFHMTTAFKAPTIFRNNILKNQLHSITLWTKK